MQTTAETYVLDEIVRRDREYMSRALSLTPDYPPPVVLETVRYVPVVEYVYVPQYVQHHVHHYVHYRLEDDYPSKPRGFLCFWR